MRIPLLTTHLRPQLARIRFEARGGITKSERPACHALLNGDGALCREILLAALQRHAWRSAAAFDTLTHLCWEAANSGAFDLDDEFISAVTEHLRWRRRTGHRTHRGSLAMWLASLEHIGRTPHGWSTSGGVRAIAASVAACDIDGSPAEAVATIRFAAPHRWLTGPRRRLPRSLTTELRLWYRWLQLWRLDDVRWHVDHNMPFPERPRDAITLDPGTPEHSNIALLHSLAAIGTALHTESISPEARTALYFAHFSFPWDSQGYCTRTQGLLTAVNATDWRVTAVTRSGYPYDIHHDLRGFDGDAPYRVGEVEYLRLGRRGEGVSNLEVKSYLDEYAERAAARIRERRPTIVHAASSAWNGIAAAQAASRFGLPCIYEVRGLWDVTQQARGGARPLPAALAREFETHAADLATHVFTITGALRDELIARGVAAEKISVLPNAVDCDRFTPRERDAELAAQLGVTGRTVIGYVGSLLDYEGLDLLLHATAALRAERDDFRVLIVGGGEAEADLQLLAQALGLDGVVTFTGRVGHAEVERYYSLIDIAPFPRKPLPVCEMVSPLKPFEAMAMAKCCVVSSVAALTEIVADGVTGAVFAKGDANALADALRTLLDDPERCRTLGAHARDWVATERTWAGTAERVRSVYERLATH